MEIKCAVKMIGAYCLLKAVGERQILNSLKFIDTLFFNTTIRQLNQSILKTDMQTKLVDFAHCIYLTRHDQQNSSSLQDACFI